MFQLHGDMEHANFKAYPLSVSLAQPSLPAKTQQIPAEAKATPAFIICVSVCLCYKDKAYF